jgi:hypothetical protein
MSRSFECDVPANVRSLATLRSRFGDWLDGFMQDCFARGDLVLTMSEMATAALSVREHERGTLRARAWTEEAGVVLEVVDVEGSVLDARVRNHEEGDGGRGLSVIASLADVLTVDDVGGATAIRARVSW